MLPTTLVVQQDMVNSWIPKGLQTQPPETQGLELSVQLEAAFQGEASCRCINPSMDGLPLIGSAKALDEKRIKLRRLVPIPDNL